MAIKKRLLTATATMAMTAGLMATAALPAEAAWRVAYIGYWTYQADCETARANHGAGLDPSEGFVSPACSYHYTYRKWYYAYTYNDA